MRTFLSMLCLSLAFLPAPVTAQEKKLEETKKEEAKKEDKEIF